MSIEKCVRLTFQTEYSRCMAKNKISALRRNEYINIYLDKLYSFVLLYYMHSNRIYIIICIIIIQLFVQYSLQKFFLLAKDL